MSRRTASASSAPSPLSELPKEIIERIISTLDDPRDFAAVNAASRLFRGEPGGSSPVENVLRERALRRGHFHRACQASDSEIDIAGVDELLIREAVLELAHAHTHVAIASGRMSLSRKTCLSACVDAAGGLHTFGEELTVVFGQAGILLSMGLAHGAPAALDQQDLLDAPVLLPIPTKSLSTVRVCAVAAGSEHLLALGECGTVYACGVNAYGQLGSSDTLTSRSFKAVHALTGEFVVCIASGGDSSIALTAAGVAYSWGDNSWGKLGHGDFVNRLAPACIKTTTCLRMGGVAQGPDHTLLLDTRGRVHACGLAFRGLGHGHTPQRIKALAHARIVHVSAGRAHNLATDDMGAVHLFRLSQSSSIDDDEPAEVGIRCERIEALAHVHAVRTSAGFDTSAVVGSDGSVHTFGDNLTGNLGHGVGAEGTERSLASSVPTQVLERERVLSCSLGLTHSLFVAADGGVHACGEVSAALGCGASMLGGPSAVAQLQRVTLLPCVRTRP